MKKRRPVSGNGGSDHSPLVLMHVNVQEIALSKPQT
jgi:hypothetical protein